MQSQFTSNVFLIFYYNYNSYANVSNEIEIKSSQTIYRYFFFFKFIKIILI